MLRSTVVYLFLLAGAVVSPLLGQTGVRLVPWPESLQDKQAVTVVKPTLSVPDFSLEPLTQVLTSALGRLTGTQGSLVKQASEAGIVFQQAPELKPGAYILEIQSGKVRLSSGTYQGFVHGCATLLQLIDSASRAWMFPTVVIKDSPAYPFRSVLLDLARFWHPVHTIKETIDLAFLYKYNYLHLHLSDHQSFTFPCKAYPGLKSYFKDGRRRHYTVEELEDLVEYARVRGIAIIPEIDVPGHARCLARGYPEAFGTRDPETGRAKDTGYVINMANEQAYQALDVLFGEISDVFYTSEYIHIGADEVSPGALTKLPEYQPYTLKHGLIKAQQGDVHELYAHFIVRMNEIIKKHGKTMVAWEGFHGTGTEHARIPDDIVIMVWNMSYNPPEQLLKNGFTIINCAWKPLYLVPPQNYMESQEVAYAWDIHHFEHRRTDIPFTRIPADADILGAQICYWEETYDQVFPLLREHIPVIAERIWSRHLDRPFSDFQQCFARTDNLVGRLYRPVAFHTQGLLQDTEETLSFDHTLTLTMTAEQPGSIRYRLDTDWGHFPDSESPVYTDPLNLKQSTVVTAALFDDKNLRCSPFTQQGFQKIEPVYRYRVLKPVPKGGWTTMPDFSTLESVRQGVLGRSDPDRIAELNRILFAKLPRLGHIDTQPYHQFNPFALELTGQIHIPGTGDYSFKVKSRFGMAQVFLDDTVVAGNRCPGGPEAVTTGHLEQGVYALRLRYFYTMIQNQLNVQFKGPGSQEFGSFDSLALSLDRWVPEAELKHLPEGTLFVDPARQAHINLATDKPVTCTGGFQHPHVPANAVDADISNDSGWHCGSSPEWLEVDLEKRMTIQRIKLYTYHDGRRYYRYLIEISTNGTDYTEVVDERQNTTVSGPKGFEHRFDPIPARYVRVTMLSNSANPGVHINELMVFDD